MNNFNFENLNSDSDIINHIAEIEISYKNKIKPSERIQVTRSYETYRCLFAIWNKDHIEHHETVKVILLDRGNKILGIREISSGGTSGSIFDVKCIFQLALKANASGVIVSHNHPSGNVQPSQQDIDITRKLVEGGKLLDIKVLDHIIITPEEGKYYSMCDEGIF